MIDPTPAILARCRIVDLPVSADTGPSEMQCRECGLLAICLHVEPYFVPVVGVGGADESWFCFLCLRRFNVRWRFGEGRKEAAA